MFCNILIFEKTFGGTELEGVLVRLPSPAHRPLLKREGAWTSSKRWTGQPMEL